MSRSVLGLFLALFWLGVAVVPSLAVQEPLEEVKSIVDRYYIYEPPASMYEATSIGSIFAILEDPYSGYYTAAEYTGLQQEMERNFCGIGVIIDEAAEGVQIVEVVPGSPAQEMGLRVGDIITQVEKRDLTGLTGEEAARLMRGSEGDRVRLKVLAGERIRSISIPRRELHIPTVRGQVLDGHIGYLDVDSFGESTVVEFRKEVARLKKQNVDSWVVDLRYNSGGYVESASLLAGYFIGDKPLMRLKERGKMSLIPAHSTGSRVTEPAVFIINEYSASAAELLAAAVQDYGRAVLIGTTTYGKGSMQEIFPLENGDVLKLTVAHFFSPKGHRINQQGVTPDIPVKDIDPLVIAGMLLK